MGNITTIQLVSMLLSVTNGDHGPNMDTLKAIYERTHNFYIAVFSGVLVLIASIVGGLITSIVKSENITGIVSWSAPFAIVGLIVVIWILIYRIKKLQKDYLDILMVYDLLSVYF
jgi:MFS family permease